MINTRAGFQGRLDVFADILIRCFFGGMGLLMVWFAAYVAAGDGIYRMHARWFQIPRQTFDAIYYAGMAVTKIAIILFFLLPWIAIKLVSQKRDTSKKARGEDPGPLSCPTAASRRA